MLGIHYIGENIWFVAITRRELLKRKISEPEMMVVIARRIQRDAGYDTNLLSVLENYACDHRILEYR